MAETTIAPDIGVSDRELFEGAVADEPVQETPVEETPAEPGEQPRDEHGRFAAKPQTDEAQAPPAEVQQQPPTEQPQGDDAQVPSWRLREIREARDAAERRAQEREQELFTMRQQFQSLQQQFQQTQQPKQEPANWFENPDQALQQRVSPLEQQFSSFQQNTSTQFSRLQAMITHGAKEVQAMEAAIKDAMAKQHPEMPLLAAQMRVSPDPAEVAMQWYTRNKLLTETGGDLASYKQRILDEAMKDPTFQAKVIENARGQAAQPNGGRPPPINLPPSLNRTPGSGASQAPADDADGMSDAALYRFATAPGKRR